MNQQQIAQAIEAISSLGRLIKQVGSIPSGHLYAQLMGVMSLDQYEAVVSILKRTGLVAERHNELVWIGD